MHIDEIRKQVAKAAMELVQDHKVIGLGTGKMASKFIEELAKKYREEKLAIKTVASSRSSLDLAKSLGLPLVELTDVTSVDITFDGADQIDRKKRMIKGRGGALFQEKILAYASDEVIVLVEDTKLVANLGRCNLPVEIAAYGATSTKLTIEKMGYSASWRVCDDHLFVTDNGNFLLDLHFPEEMDFPEQIHQEIKQLAGVIETGFFPSIAKKIVVGYPQGKTEIFT
jgi:ribose 5-phosphate isomerase A